MIAASGDGTVDSCRFDPTPQYKHKRISWVTHSSLAMLSGLGCDAEEGQADYRTCFPFVKKPPSVSWGG